MHWGTGGGALGANACLLDLDAFGHPVPLKCMSDAAGFNPFSACLRLASKWHACSAFLVLMPLASDRVVLMSCVGPCGGLAGLCCCCGAQRAAHGQALQPMFARRGNALALHAGWCHHPVRQVDRVRARRWLKAFNCRHCKQWPGYRQPHAADGGHWPGP